MSNNVEAQIDSVTIEGLVASIKDRSLQLLTASQNIHDSTSNEPTSEAKSPTPEYADFGPRCINRLQDVLRILENVSTNLSRFI